MSVAANPTHGRVVSGLASSTPKDALPLLQLDRRTYDRALDCVHCGLCLPACPTYTQNGLEADSPRGRIYLMKGLADGRVAPTDAVVRHLDLCLDCRACETACPSGVVYHELIEETREKLAATRPKPWSDRLLDQFFFHVFPHPTRLKLSLLPAILLQRLGLWKSLINSPLTMMLPGQFQKMQRMLPTRKLPLWEQPLGELHPAVGVKKKTVGLLTGCVGSVLYQHVNRQTVRLLTHFGAEVRVPRTQRCCGAIHHHGGKSHEAQELAKRNIDALLPGDDPTRWPDDVVTNIAGCGAMLKDYDHLLRDDPDYRDKAGEFVKRVRDVSQTILWLDPAPPEHEVRRTVTYHDACHLLHAQKVSDPPRVLLSKIRGLTLVPLPESDMCCGAAGTYNLSQPEMARPLAERKLKHIAATGAGSCVTGNVGCAMQIQSEADRLCMGLTVLHPVTLLHEAYFGPDA